ncbi:Altered inheritance of mitochondria protein 6-like [Pseudocercospora fuligena]|uniref:Altered inheritance of mitochondria protein 6 n=1 Tax=Pseudocercospora fuligena TaxID=685502 RepID=A0A8H6VQJ8_9PEZI|nr:Altered inheritance of mitochondria protein 6-like [Pseudocercospora fuligena]
MRMLHNTSVGILSRFSNNYDLLSMDPESLQPEVGQTKQDREYLARVGRLPVPLRKGHVASDAVKYIACFAIAVCIFQFVWIRRIQQGLVRITNDPWDLRFPQHLKWSSPSIFEEDRMSFVHDATPVPIHSHNDYVQRIPVFEALGSGCTSVEADIHLVDNDLLVGHSSVGLHSTNNLRNMYLEPLKRMIDHQNPNGINETWHGIFNQAPQQTIVLLVDHKTSGPETFNTLYTQLQPLRNLDYLTYWNGTTKVLRPLTIVSSGSAPFDSILALNSTHRDIFYDAKLECLLSAEDDITATSPTYKYNASNSHYASTQWHNAHLWREYYCPYNETNPAPSNAMDVQFCGTHMQQANARGLLARFWNTPNGGPRNLRDVVWRVLVDLKVDVINMDDMGVVRERSRGWGRKM